MTNRMRGLAIDIATGHATGLASNLASGGATGPGLLLLALISVIASVSASACSSDTAPPAEPVVTASRFIIVSPPPGQDWTEAGFVSADGRTVVGLSGVTPAKGINIFRYTVTGTGSRNIDWLEPPDVLPQGLLGVFGLDVSSRGSAMLGSVFHDQTNTLFWWSEAAGMTRVADVAGVPLGLMKFAISGDGAVAVGTLAKQAFRWTVATGRVDLGKLGADTANEAVAVSADGRVVVGNSWIMEGSSPTLNDISRAFRWTEETGIVALDVLPDHVSCQTLGHMSDDGRVLFGRCFQALLSRRGQLVRWNETGAVEGLGTPAPYANSRPFLVSDDGAVVVGDLEPAAPPTGLGTFRWTQQSGLVQFPIASTLTSCFPVKDLTPDGLTFVASCHSVSQGGAVAVKWTEGMDPLVLQTPVGFTHSVPSSISADGRVVTGVGRRTTGNDTIDLPVIWREGAQPRAVADFLREQGVVSDLRGVTLRSVRVSADASTLTGDGLDDAGKRVAWIARLR